MRAKLKIFLLFFIVMMVFSGCIEPQRPPGSNETTIATSEPTPDQMPAYNETMPVETNATFETWSRGYWSNLSYEQTYFRIITNYSEWNEFLDNQGYFAYIRGEEGMRLEGELFPGGGNRPKTIEPAEFNNYFVLAAMMGLRGHLEDEIEITNIRKVNNIVNVSVRMYKPSFGAGVESAPYHIVIIKREILPKGNSTFVFIDTERKELGRVEIRE
ncbi:MAG: hypothetical protein FIB08_04570 [Candidatus Methanoperedens sp.]|nr:hypothetical protein [Candidatus Methanoperedens sp.]